MVELSLVIKTTALPGYLGQIHVNGESLNL